jgi:hypothetical protein
MGVFRSCAAPPQHTLSAEVCALCAERLRSCDSSTAAGSTSQNCAHITVTGPAVASCISRLRQLYSFYIYIHAKMATAVHAGQRSTTGSAWCAAAQLNGVAECIDNYNAATARLPKPKQTTQQVKQLQAQLCFVAENNLALECAGPMPAWQGNTLCMRPHQRPMQPHQRLRPCQPGKQHSACGNAAPPTTGPTPAWQGPHCLHAAMQAPPTTNARLTATTLLIHIPSGRSQRYC